MNEVELKNDVGQRTDIVTSPQPSPPVLGNPIEPRPQLQRPHKDSSSSIRSIPINDSSDSLRRDSSDSQLKNSSSLLIKTNEDSGRVSVTFSGNGGDVGSDDRNSPKNKEKANKVAFDTEGNNENGQYASHTPSKINNTPKLSEVITYLVFMGIFIGISFGTSRGEQAYWFNNEMQNALVYQEFHFSDSQFKKVFFDINNYQDFWNWLTGPFIDNAFPMQWYNNEELTLDEQRYINNAARLVGPIRLRQKRVKLNSCNIASKFRSIVNDCYPGLTASNEDKSPFGPNLEYKYTPSEGLEDTYFAQINSFDGGGFILDLDRYGPNATIQIQSLKNNSWVDLQTRVVFVDLTVYDPDIDLFCVVRMTTEFPPATGAVPSATFRVMRIFGYMYPKDYARLFFELILVMFVFFYIFEEITEMKALRWEYLNDPWNYIDWLNILIFLVVIILRIFNTSYVSYAKFNVEDNSFVNIHPVAFLIDMERNVNAANAFILWFRLFKYLRISRRLSQLTDTLSSAAADLVVFLGIFFIVFFGYAQAGWMLFSVDIQGFRTLLQSIYSLFRQTLGDFDFDAMEQSNRYLGPLFFFSFSILVMFILMNMFLAIINDTYSEVKLNSKATAAREFSFKQMITVSVGNALKKIIKKRNQVSQIREAFESADKDHNNMLDEDEVAAVLRENSSINSALGEDIKGIIRHYDKDGNKKLDQKETQELLDFLKQKEQSLDTASRALQQSQKLNEPSSSSNQNTGALLSPRGMSSRNAKTEAAELVNRMTESALMGGSPDYDSLRSSIQTLNEKVNAMELNIQKILHLMEGNAKKVKRDKVLKEDRDDKQLPPIMRPRSNSVFNPNNNNNNNNNDSSRPPK